MGRVRHLSEQGRWELIMEDRGGSKEGERKGRGGRKRKTPGISGASHALTVPCLLPLEEHRGPCSEESLMDHPGGRGRKLAKDSPISLAISLWPLWLTSGFYRSYMLAYFPPHTPPS